MTREEHERLYALVQNPPPGSKMEAAKLHGVDLTLNLRSLTCTRPSGSAKWKPH